MEAIIIGKGNSAIKLKRKDHPHKILVGINQAVNLIDDPDYFVLNDIESLIGIKPSKLARIKNIIIPEYPHSVLKPGLDLNYKKFHQLIKEKFTGNLIVHNLHTTPKFNPKFITISERPKTSATIAVEYLLKFLGVKKIDFYGVGTGNGYHPYFMKILPNNLSNFSNNYNKRKPLRIKEFLIKLTAEKYPGSTLNFH